MGLVDGSGNLTSRSISERENVNSIICSKPVISEGSVVNVC